MAHMSNFVGKLTFSTKDPKIVDELLSNLSNPDMRIGRIEMSENSLTVYNGTCDWVIWDWRTDVRKMITDANKQGIKISGAIYRHGNDPRWPDYQRLRIDENAITLEEGVVMFRNFDTESFDEWPDWAWEWPNRS